MICNEVSSKARGVCKWERVRRLRYGALIKLFRHRWGPTLPDDSSGRENLFELVCVVSAAVSATAERIVNTIETWAPWMQPEEAQMLVEHVRSLNIFELIPNNRVLGERMRLTNAEREQLHLWPIKPVDMTDEQLAEQRKAKSRERRTSKHVSMRLWVDEPGGKLKAPTTKDYETVGYIISGSAKLDLEGQTLNHGDSWLVPAGASHQY